MQKTMIDDLTLQGDRLQEEQVVDARFRELLSACEEQTRLSREEKTQIVRAFSIARRAHAGTRRKSGELYIFHPLAVALIAVKEIGLGPIAVVCALLHDVVEDTDISLEELRSVFGDRVATIVDGLTKIEDVMEMHQGDSKQAENYRKILLSMCKDAYVIFLKLCDRLHNMRTLGSMKDTKKIAISSETQYLYIPLAHRLGLYGMKTELEELVMHYTNPERYDEISGLINKSAGTEVLLADCLTKPIREMLDSRGYKYRIKTRIKSVYSCWKKMENKDVSFDEIYDLYAMRIILDVDEAQEKEECFKVYSLISSKFPPNPSRFRDWITTPKMNGYESLHTTVMTPIGRWVEIQIRSERMNTIAEKGMAAHFLYKEAHPEMHAVDNPVEEWLRQIRVSLETADKSAIDLVEDFRERLYTREIYLFTPKGLNVHLPQHSTVLDFAFAIHTDLGLHCIGAKVNAKVVGPSYVLQSGEQVQVLTSRHTVPESDWLNQVHTQRAKESLKDWFRERKKERRNEGEKKLQALLFNLHIEPDANQLARLRQYFHYNTDLDLYYDVAIDKVGIRELKLALGLERPEPRLVFLDAYKDLFKEENGRIESTGNEVIGETSTNVQSFLLDKDYEHITISPAPCCSPVQGDQVVGIAEGERIVVHRTNCKVAMNHLANHENNVVRAKWREGEQVSFLTGITLTAIDHKGLLQELTHVISQEMGINMRAVTLEASEGVVRGIIMLYINNLDSLNRLIDTLSAVEGVEQVRRI